MVEVTGFEPAIQSSETVGTYGFLNFVESIVESFSQISLS